MRENAQPEIRRALTCHQAGVPIGKLLEDHCSPSVVRPGTTVPWADAFGLCLLATKAEVLLAYPLVGRSETFAQALFGC